MKWMPTIVVLVLAVLSLAALLYLRPGDAGRPAGDVRRGPLFAAGQVPVDQITGITLKRGDDPALVFQREGDTWSQVEPFAYPMDPFSVRQLAVQVAQLDAVDEAQLDGEAGFSAAALALDPPEAVLTLQWPDGSLALQLGRRGIAGRAYLRVQGEQTVHVVNQALHDRAVEMDVREWRDRRIFHGAGVESDRIERVEGGSRLVLERELRQWSVREPVETRLDPVAADEIFHAVGNAQIGGFILDEPDSTALERFGLAAPVATFEIVTGRPAREGEQISRVTETQRLLVGSTIGAGSLERFGMIEGRPVVVRLTVPVLQALFPPPQNLIDPTASGVNPADVMSLRIRGPEGELVLRRDLERWLAPNAGPDGGDLELHAPHVQELLDQLTDLRAPAVEIQVYPRDLEIATITMYGHGRRPLDTVRIAREPDTGRWALENGDNVLRIFQDSLAMRLTPADFGIPADSP
ncbi:MAG: DUF4340 domain-containing protein [Phycisphaerales bacterium]|nr:MAG: DUF4340 domain-containing protein [Phycisphaerales bacterium]